MLFEPKSASFNRSSGDISSLKSTGIHKNDTTTDLTSVVNSGSVLPKLLNQNNRLGVTLAGNYMKQDKIAYYHNAVVNIYIVYKLQKRTGNSPDFTVQNVLFGAIKIAKDVNTRHCKYSGYGICFDGNSSFSFGNSINANIVIIFGCDMSFSSHANNRANNTYVVGQDFIQVIKMAPQSMQKNYTKQTLQNKIKNLYSLYITMVIIVIYSLMV